MVELVPQFCLFHNLFGARCDYFTLLPNTEFFEISESDAVFVVEVFGEEARGAHMVPCLLVVPVMQVVLVLYR